MKKKIKDLITRRCKAYQEKQKIRLLEDKDGNRNFFRQTKNYLSKERPAPFDVMNMFPNMTEGQVAELLAEHFNAISNEFVPLDFARDLPVTHSVPLPVLATHEVAMRLKRFRKPKSMVRGDIFPDLVTKFADLLAVPLTSIYNEITATKIWPEIWKN